MAFRWGAGGAALAFVVAVALLRSSPHSQAAPPDEPVDPGEPAALIAMHV
jgi:hypothetical protein